MTSYNVDIILLYEEGISYYYPDNKTSEIIEYNEDNINRIKDIFFNSTIQIEVYSDVDITRWLFRILKKLTELGFKIDTTNIEDGWLRMYRD